MQNLLFNFVGRIAFGLNENSKDHRKVQSYSKNETSFLTRSPIKGLISLKYLRIMRYIMNKLYVSITIFACLINDSKL